MGKSKKEYLEKAKQNGIKNPETLSWNDLRKAAAGDLPMETNEKGSAVGGMVDIEGEAPKTGLGDAIASITKATGLDKLVKKDCGCQERQEFANRPVTYVMIKKGTMNDDLLRKWEELGIENKKNLSPDEQKLILSMYNTIFQSNISYCAGCSNGAKYKTYIVRIQGVYDRMMQLTPNYLKDG